MAAPDLKVVPLYESNLRDPVATLRNIADQMEAGEYGEIGSVAMVVMGDTLEVFGFGADSETPTVALLLHAGFQKISTAIMNHGA